MCTNNSKCGCGSSNNNECTPQLGPFEAIDSACITSPATTAGFIIPFSSGPFPIFLASLVSGSPEIIASLGFGSSIQNTAGPIIDLSTFSGTEAFNVPRAGTITSISATFSSLVSVTLVGTAQVSAQIYRAPAGSNIFSPTTAFVDLTPTLSTISIGTITSGTRNVPPVPVAAGDRLLMVFSVTSSTGIVTLTGNASAGIGMV